MKKTIERKHLDKLLQEQKFAEYDELVRSAQLPAGELNAMRAIGFMKAKENQKAETFFLKALESDPDNILANGHYAQLLISEKRHKGGLPYAEKAHQRAPKHLQFALNLAACLSESDRHGDAHRVLKPFAEVDSPEAKVLVAYATLLRADLQTVEAIAQLERARELYPENAEAQKAIADAYSEMDPALASQAFSRADQTLPNNMGLRWNWSFVELRLKNFQLAWELYETGLEDKIGKVGRPLPAQVRAVPRLLNLDNLDPNKWTLLCAEQGLGDQVLFYSTLREAMRDIPKLVLIAEQRMVPVLKRSFPTLEVYPFTMAAVFAAQTHKINGLYPIGSLMKKYRSSISAFGQTEFPYLVPNPDLVTKYKTAILKHHPKDKIIGLSWRGGYWERQKRTKSLDFEALAPLFRMPGVRFVSLQYGDTAAEKELATKNKLPVSFISGVDFQKDIDGWFALISACDHIVSVSTAMVHFAAASGKKVELLLSSYQSPFIWSTDVGPSYAYPSVNIHRMEKEEGMEAFVERVKNGMKL